MLTFFVFSNVVSLVFKLFNKHRTKHVSKPFQFFYNRIKINWVIVLVIHLEGFFKKKSVKHFKVLVNFHLIYKKKKGKLDQELNEQ